MCAILTEIIPEKKLIRYGYKIFKVGDIIDNELTSPYSAYSFGSIEDVEGKIFKAKISPHDEIEGYGYNLKNNKFKIGDEITSGVFHYFENLIDAIETATAIKNRELDKKFTICSVIPIEYQYRGIVKKADIDDMDCLMSKHIKVINVKIDFEIYYSEVYCIASKMEKRSYSAIRSLVAERIKFFMPDIYLAPLVLVSDIATMIYRTTDEYANVYHYKMEKRNYMYRKLEVDFLSTKELLETSLNTVNKKDEKIKRLEKKIKLLEKQK